MKWSELKAQGEPHIETVRTKARELLFVFVRRTGRRRDGQMLYVVTVMQMSRNRENGMIGWPKLCCGVDEVSDFTEVVESVRRPMPEKAIWKDEDLDAWLEAEMGLSRKEVKQEANGMNAEALHFTRRYKGSDFTLEISRNGRGPLYQVFDAEGLGGKKHRSPSAAGTQVTGKPCNGWAFWRIPQETRERLTA